MAYTHTAHTLDSQATDGAGAAFSHPPRPTTGNMILYTENLKHTHTHTHTHTQILITLYERSP